MTNNKNKLAYKGYLKTLVLNMLGESTTPLIKILQLALLGRYTTVFSMIALGLAFTLFNTMDWILGILKVSVTEESAKASRQNNEKAQSTVLLQHILLVWIVGIFLILFKEQIWQSIEWIYRVETPIMRQTKLFYDYTIWGVFMYLTNNMIIGWLSGVGDIKYATLLEAGRNGTTIIVSAILVVRGQGIAGIANAFIYGQIVCLIAGVGILLIKKRFIFKYITKQSTWDLKRIALDIYKKMDNIYNAIFVVLVMNIFMSISCQFGNIILAANLILMQVKDIMGHLFEAIFKTVRSYKFQARRQGDTENYQELYRLTLINVMYVTIGSVMFYSLARYYVADWIIPFDLVKDAFLRYDGWLLIYPILGGWGLSAYGLYADSVKKKIAIWTCSIGLVVFGVMYLICVPILGNHGMWLSYILFYFVHSVGLLVYEGFLYNQEN